MLSEGDINPLNVFGLRELNYIPPHFTKFYFTLRASEKDIKDWVYSRLEGRFCLTQEHAPGRETHQNKDKFYLSNCIGFENPAESAYFALMLDQINTSIWF